MCSCALPCPLLCRHTHMQMSASMNSQADTHMHTYKHMNTHDLWGVEGASGPEQEYTAWLVTSAEHAFHPGALVSPELPESHPMEWYRPLVAHGSLDVSTTSTELLEPTFWEMDSRSGRWIPHPPTHTPLILSQRGLGFKALPHLFLSSLPPGRLLCCVCLSTAPGAFLLLPRPLPSTWIPGHWVFQQQTYKIVSWSLPNPAPILRAWSVPSPSSLVPTNPTFTPITGSLENLRARPWLQGRSHWMCFWIWLSHGWEMAQRQNLCGPWL